jgi:hypothetical protein
MNSTTFWYSICKGRTSKITDRYIEEN